MFGLMERDIYYINKVLAKFIEVDKALIFGSRAMGNYKKGSDVDIALIGDNISNNILMKIEDQLNEVYPIPYFFDILIYKDINNEKLKEHIDEESVLIYEKIK